MRLHLSPAYGRDYKTEAEVRAAWNDGKDFRMENGPAAGGYINKGDAENMGVPTGEVNIRFNKKTEVCVISGLPKAGRKIA